MEKKNGLRNKESKMSFKKDITQHRLKCEPRCHLIKIWKPNEAYAEYYCQGLIEHKFNVQQRPVKAIAVENSIGNIEKPVTKSCCGT